VGVAVDEDIQIRAAEVPLHRAFDREVGRILGDRDVVRHADAQAVELEQPGLAQPGVVGLNGTAAGAVVAVSAGRVGARDVGKLVDNDEVVDVPRVQDRTDAREGIEDLRPQLMASLGDVGVGDEPNAHDQEMLPERGLAFLRLSWCPVPVIRL
jgi:hypothetical protein